MSKITNMPADMMRIDTSRINNYLYADQPKLTFMQKLGRGLGKAFSFLGPIGAAVTAVAVPGFGIPLAMGIYGASKLSADMTNRALSKDASEMQAYQAKMNSQPMSLPGLFDPSTQGDIQTDFMVPSQLEGSTSRVIINREAMNTSMVDNFHF